MRHLLAPDNIIYGYHIWYPDILSVVYKGIWLLFTISLTSASGQNVRREK